MIYNVKEEDINIILYFFKLIFMETGTFYILDKSINTNKSKLNRIFMSISIILIAIISCVIKQKVDIVISLISMFILLAITFSSSTKYNIGYSITVIIFSLSINYILFFLATMLNGLPNLFLNIQNDIVSFIMITITYMLLLYILVKIKRFKYGFSFINKTTEIESMEILLLNLGAIILFSIVIFHNYIVMVTDKLGVSIFILAMIMFYSIQKSIQLYYRQKLIIKELSNLKLQVEEKEKEIQKLEKENIELSKKNHSFNHKYKALEHKLKEELLKTETAEEISLKDQLDDLSKEIYVIPQNTDPSKTNIEKIDDMLKFMQSECNKHKITFNLQVIGNIYHITNNFISQEELQILIADHIKDAIIAINHSDNINKSILVKLGRIEDCYGLYIYDSGIEFEKETLENLGKKPITTYINEGGSGMGFMNTFDTLRRHNASLIIEELGKPCKDNFTKIIKFRFDGKNEFKVVSYRN